MISVGMTVDNRYKILREIGRGGTSCVYLAENIRLHNLWAIKEVYKSSITGEGVESKTLIAESSLLTRLDHKGLPRIIDVIDGEETFLIVMEYIDGISLEKLIENQGAQSEDDVLKWGRQLCDVLEYIHGQTPPIIYRDMKPANIMLKPNGDIVLIDFGMAREFKWSNSHDTTMLGTHGYAAPEQYSGNRQSDERTDIYGLGVTLYHLITGCDPCQPPYGIQPIRSVNPNLSPVLEQIIQKCTKLEPDMRYQNARELNNALNGVRNGGSFNNLDNFNRINSQTGFTVNPYGTNTAYTNNPYATNSGYGGGSVNNSGYLGGNTNNGYPVNSGNNAAYQGGGYVQNPYGTNTGYGDNSANLAPDASMEEMETKKGSKLWWLLVLVPILIVLIVVAVVLGMSSGDNYGDTDPDYPAYTYTEAQTTAAEDTGVTEYEQEVIIGVADKREYYTITPDVSGYYKFYSVSGAGLPVIWVSDEYDNTITSANTRGEYSDFEVTCYLSEGEEYIIETTLYDLNPDEPATGSYWIYVDYMGNTP